MRKFIGYVLAFLMVMGAGLIVAYSAGGEPVEFGNNTTTTCYVGGDYGEVNCTGNITGAYLFGDGSELTGLAGGGDINAVNTDGPYLSGGADSGAVSLLVNETYLNVSIDARATGLGDNESFNESYTNTLYSNDTWVDTYFVRFTELVSQLGNFSAWDKAYSDLIGTPTHLGNFTDDLGDRGYTHLGNFTDDLGYENNTHLSNLTDDLGDRGYTHLGNFTDDLNDRGYTNLGNFTDDLGDRGYIHLGNFTDDLGYNNNTHLSNLTDDLGDRGYTHLSNFTDDLTYTNDTWVDNYFVRFTELVDQLGNFSAWDKAYSDLIGKPTSNLNFTNDAGYYNSSDFTIGDYALDSKVDSIGNWSADQGDYYNTTDIDGFSYYNSSDFSIGDYFNNITNFTGTLINNKICIYDASQQIINCTYTDQTGASGNPKAGDGTYLYNDTDTMYLNSTYANANLNSNSSGYWDNLGSPSDINAGDITDDGTFSNDTWVDAYFVRFTELVDQIGNWSADKSSYALDSKVDSIGNFSAYVQPTHLGNFTDDLGDRGYTSLTNFSNDLGIGNWSDDKSDYYTSTQTDTAIETANTSMKGYVDALDTATNTSMKTYVDAQDVIFNTSVANYADTQDIVANTSVVNWVDALFPRTTELVGLVGNWSADKDDYWNSSTDLDSVIATDEITELKIDFNTACGAGSHLYVSGNNLACETDDDTTYDNTTGISLVGTTFGHSDTSSQASDENSGNTFIQDIVLDSFGHITSIVNAGVDFSSYVAIADIVGYVGNWSDDQGDYYNSTQTDTAIESANTSMKTYVDSNPEGYTTNTGTVTSVATDDTYLTGGAITSTGTITLNTTLAGTSLAVNSSDHWDNLGSPSDIGTGDITDDGTWRLQSWDNITGIPHATPADSDVTHFSLSDEIYDWVVGLAYTPIADLVAQLGNWSADKTNYYNKTEANSTIILIDTATNTSMKTYVDTQDISTNTSMKTYVDALDTATNGTMKTYVDAQDIAVNTTMKTYSDAAFEPISQAHFDASTTMNITCFNQACDLYMNATDSCQYWPSGGKTCGA